MPEPAQDNLLPFKVRDRRAPGWHWNQNEIVDLWGPVIGAYGVAVYSVLSRFSRDNEVDELSWPRIARLLKVSRTMVFKTLRQLEGHGLIRHRQRPGGESTYILVDLKAIPVHQVDGCLGGKQEPAPPVHQVNGCAGGKGGQQALLPVHQVNGYQGGYPSTTRTGGVHQVNGTRSPHGLHKGSKTQDCKTTTLPPSPLPEGKSVNALARKMRMP